MQANGRFAVAIHLLSLLVEGRSSLDGASLTSERMAESVNTHPVVVRRILGSLRTAGFVTSQPGPGGGWKLTRSAAEISLWDVLRAVEQAELFAFPQRRPLSGCSVGNGLPAVLEGCLRDAQLAMAERLGDVSVADV